MVDYERPYSLILTVDFISIPPYESATHSRARGSVPYFSWYPELTLRAIERVALNGLKNPLAFRLRAFRRYAETGWLANWRFVDD